MRTTLTLDDAAAEVATLYAESRGISLGKAVSELVTQAAGAKPRIKYVDDLPVFDMPRSKAVSTAHVRELEADEQ